MINKPLSLRNRTCPGNTRSSAFKQGVCSPQQRGAAQDFSQGLLLLLFALQRRDAGLGALPQAVGVFGGSAQGRGGPPRAHRSG